MTEQLARDALNEIVACDYRGNRPPEQEIATRALREIAFKDAETPPTDDLDEALDVLAAVLSGDKLSRCVEQTDLDAALALLHKHGRWRQVVRIG